MVLVVNDELLSRQDIRSLQSLYSRFPHLLSDAERLAATKPKIVRPEGVLYVRQKEFAVTHLGDRFSDGLSRILHVGTDDVLTCHVLVLHHPFTKVVALAHFDEYVTGSVLAQFVSGFLAKVRERYFEDDGCDNDPEDDDEEYEWEEDESDTEEFAFDDPIHLHLVGGYADEAGKAHKLSQRILAFFHDLGNNCTGNDDDVNEKVGKEKELENDKVFHLQTCCLGKPNSRPGRYYSNREPIIGGVLVSLTRNNNNRNSFYRNSGFFGNFNLADCQNSNNSNNSISLIPATFNRCFASEIDEDLRMTLLLGPSLIRRPAKLKRLILEKEDRGYGSKTARTLG